MIYDLTLMSLLTANCTLSMQMVQHSSISTTIRDSSFAAQNAVLHEASSWMPSVDNVDQYVEVDFGRPWLLTGVTTQGRGSIPNYVTSYTVEYAYSTDHWNTYQEKPGVDKVRGLSDFIHC